MVYDPAKHNRISIRLKGYDYSQPGFYFITICVQNRICFFGRITDNKMILNDAGKMIDKWYFELENKYPNTKCREYVIMPNHIHFIVEITDAHGMDVHEMDDQTDVHGGTSLRGRPISLRGAPYGMENKKYHASLFDMMGWFKTMTTNEYIRGVKTNNWRRFQKRLWQLRYWDWIIRNNDDYIRISKYIKNNPAKWEEDKFNR
jgi:REP element-mobilizing transposase RayT